MLNKPWFLTGVFLISFVNLLFELLFVRITSVTLAPQSAFVAISIALCGMTIGALIVFLTPRLFKSERTEFWLWLSALLFALTEVAATWSHLHTKFEASYVQTNLLPFSFTYACMLLPFISSGVCICLALARYPNSLGKTYAADLCGAAFACLSLPIILTFFDGVSACIFVASLGGLSSLAFAIGGSRRLVAASLIATTCFLALSFFNLQSHFMKIEWKIGQKEGGIDFESWNSHSRVICSPPFNGPALFNSKSSSAPESFTKQIVLIIDSVAETTIPLYDRDLQKLAYLKFDVTNAGYYLRNNAKVLVIGVGGGRDVLSALVFGARDVTAVEINQTIINLLRNRYSQFNQVSKDPRVHLINEDGRTFLIRTKETFDFIQISLVDTLAATASGALIYTENSIYTVEAWRLAIQRLSDHGIFSFSYWYFEDWPIFHRFVYLAAAALRLENIDNPREHLLLLTNKTGKRCLGTLLVCRSPFSRQDLSKIKEVAARLGYRIAFDPEQADQSEDIQTLTQLDYRAEPNFLLAPPTDDRPFPFVTKPFPWKQPFASPQAIPLVVSFTFAMLGIFLPLLLSKRTFSFIRAVPLIIYFAMIGFGFIFFEMSQIQKLSIFLGHPTLSLTVVLGILLFSSGLGSFLIQTAGLAHLARNSRVILVSLVLGLLLYQLVSSAMLEWLSTSGVTVKILMTIAVISPIGVLLGMALPLGMDRVSAEDNQMIAWMWGINGAASVLGSVAAVLFAMHVGIRFVYATVIACYGIALACTMAWERGALPEVSGILTEVSSS
jgi:hypothetical protein